jgi:putative membrane protein insertion efficiency factor
VKHLLIFLVRLYQVLLSPFLGGQCRFTPSCSEYAVLCLHEHGALRGAYYTLRRLGRCHPFGGMGYDPPPSRKIGHG